MKIEDGFLKRQVADQTVVLPVGGGLDLNMMITLNETGSFHWDLLQSDTDEATLNAALLTEYDVDEAAAREAVAAFIRKLDKYGFLT